MTRWPGDPASSTRAVVVAVTQSSDLRPQSLLLRPQSFCVAVGKSASMERLHRDVVVPVVCCTFPAARRQVLDLCTRSSLDRGLRPHQITDEQLSLNQRSGIRQSAICVHATRPRSAGVTRMAGRSRQADASDAKMPRIAVQLLDTLTLSANTMARQQPFGAADKSRMTTDGRGWNDNNSTRRRQGRIPSPDALHPD
jgi:hypothetical protein